MINDQTFFLRFSIAMEIFYKLYLLILIAFQDSLKILKKYSNFLNKYYLVYKIKNIIRGQFAFNRADEIMFELNSLYT